MRPRCGGCPQRDKSQACLLQVIEAPPSKAEQEAAKAAKAAAKEAAKQRQVDADLAAPVPERQSKRARPTSV